jgi:hypothetical protein
MAKVDRIQKQVNELISLIDRINKMTAELGNDGIFVNLSTSRDSGNSPTEIKVLGCTATIDYLKDREK